MEKNEINKSKWNYTKVAAYGGTIGLIVAIIYTAYNFIRIGVTEPLGGFFRRYDRSIFFNYSWFCYCRCHTFCNL